MFSLGLVVFKGYSIMSYPTNMLSKRMTTWSKNVFANQQKPNYVLKKTAKTHIITHSLHLFHFIMKKTHVLKSVFLFFSRV